MSYTPPAGNAANLTFRAGYSAPAGNAANLSFVTTPIASIQAGASAAFAGVAVASASFAVAGVGAVSGVGRGFAAAAVAIQGGSAVAFTHATRDLQIVTGSTAIFTLGAITTAVASIAGQASTNFERYYPPPMQGSTAVAMTGGGIVSTKFAGAGRAYPSFKGIYELPTRFVGFGKSGPDIQGESVAQSAYAGGGRALAEFSTAGVRSGSATIAGAASFAPDAGALKPAPFAAVAGSLADLFGVGVLPSSFHLSAASAVGVSGDYTTVELSPPSLDADVIFVLSRRPREVYCGV